MKDLLQPRFIVVADYPQSIFESEQIITPDNGTTYIEYSDNGCKIEIVLSDYPHLFRPLHWSEFLKDEDKPRYLKYKVNPNIVEKVDRYLITIVVLEGERPTEIKNFLPATETEYNNFINQKKMKTESKIKIKGCACYGVNSIHPCFCSPFSNKKKKEIKTK